MRHALCSLSCALALFSVSTTTRAATFDDRGRLVLDDDGWSLGLDRLVDVPVEHDLTIYDTAYAPMTSTAASTLFVSLAEGLEGKGALALGGVAPYATLSLSPLPSALEGRRVAYTLWQRPLGTRVAVDIYVYTGDYDAAIASGNYQGLAFVGLVGMRPTGRVTSDGYEEWSTGPIDFLAGHTARPAVVTFTDEQLLTAQSSYFASYDTGAQVLVDAFEVTDLGPAAVPDAPCRLLDENLACGEEGMCLYGRCVDAQYIEGTPPADAHAADYLARRRREMRLFEGGRLPQDLLVDFDETLAGLAAAPPDARFFPTLRAAVDALRDGHASAPAVGYAPSSSTGVCAHQGDADLLEGAGALPIVFSKGESNPVSDLVFTGDALVAIDGLPPFAWAEIAQRAFSYSGDPAGRDVVIASTLIDAALTAGSVLTFASCPTSRAAPEPCAPGEEIVVDVDAREVLGDLMWAGQAPAWRAEYRVCDHRFTRPVEADDVTDYAFAGVAELDDGVRALLINGVPSAYETPAWHQAAFGFTDGSSSLLLLDERTGHGGSIDAVDLLAGRLVEPGAFSHMELLPIAAEPLDDETRAALTACDHELGLCAGGFTWPLGMTLFQTGTASDARLAVLMADDVSGNDYVTRLVQERAAPTRIFGAGATYGAFGVIWTLPPTHHELVGGSFQVHDTLFVRDASAPAPPYSTGVGVVPDEVVLQTQSDAIRGIDTVLTRARAWLVEGSAP